MVNQSKQTGNSFIKIALIGLFGMTLNVFADNASGVPCLVFPCSDDRFELEISGKTATWQGQTKNIRYIINRSTVGSERFKQLYAMALTAISSGLTVWCGTNQATNTYITWANCGAGDAPGQEVGGMSIIR